MSLDAGLTVHTGRVRDLAHRLDGFLNGLKARLPCDEGMRQAFVNARQTVGFIHAECTELETLLATARMTGDLEQPVKAEDLELHPAFNRRGVEEKRSGGDREHELMLESLHRVGDHTLDEDEPASQRLATTEEPASLRPATTGGTGNGS